MTLALLVLSSGRDISREPRFSHYAPFFKNLCGIISFPQLRSHLCPVAE